MLNSNFRYAKNIFTDLAFISTLIALIIYGLIAGFFYAYSVDVMPALDQLPAQSAIHAMQEINIAVRNPVFFATFFGPLFLGALTMVLIVLAKNKKATIYCLLALLIYFLTAFLPTSSINVPMNIELGMINLPINEAEALKIWSVYSEKWTFWNTLRTIGSTTALIFIALSLTAQKR